MSGIRCIYRAALALYVFLRKPQSSTKSLERQRKNAIIHNSLRSIKQIAVWLLSPFSPGKFCELRDFAYGQNLYVLYAKFPPPKAIRLQLVYAPPIPTGEE